MAGPGAVAYAEPEASDYDKAMGRDPARRQTEDERYALGSHKEELTGDLAQARHFGEAPTQQRAQNRRGELGQQRLGRRHEGGPPLGRGRRVARGEFSQQEVR